MGSEIRRILVVKLAGIGDLLTSFPALEALRMRFPDAEISILVTPQSASVLEGSGLVDRVIPLDKYSFDDARGILSRRSLSALLNLARKLRSQRFDAVILLHHLIFWSGTLKYAFLVLATGARLRVGLDDGRGRFLNLKAKDRGFGAVHEVDYWLETVGLLGAKNPNPRVWIPWGEEETRYADEAWAALGLAPDERVVAMHPGTGDYSPARRWAPERFAQAARSFRDDGLTPLVIAGPGEEELASQVVAGAGEGCRLVKGAATPRHMAALLSRCALFVGNDSGVMHMAVAAGIPVVAIFGLTNHRAWGPYDPSHTRSHVVRLDLSCSPCMYTGQSLGLRYGCGNPRCLIDLSPDLVISAARDLLARTR